MVRLWDEAGETRVYEPRSGDALSKSYWTNEELEENTAQPVNKPAQDWGVIVAWVDGVFYRAREVKNVFK